MEERIKNIHERIKNAALSAGRDPGSVRLVGVSKTYPAEVVETAVKAGADILGENYLQEAVEKIEALAELGVSWHFIGHLQSKKAKTVVKYFDLIHSVDSLKLAREIDKQAKKIGKIQDLLVQVNIGEEASKSGTAKEELETLVAEIALLPNVSVKGLMCMPPFFGEPERARPYFKSLRQMAEGLKEKGIEGISMDELSMGMTGDFEVAIEEGATLVRIGTALFGRRG